MMAGCSDDIFDRYAVQRAFSRAAATYDEHAVLQREVAARLLHRLQWLEVQPRRILDLGCGTGEPAGHLIKAFRGTQLVALDISPAMLKYARRRGHWLKRPRPVCADFTQLPLASASVDLVFSSLAMQWCGQPLKMFTEIRRVLRPDGVLLFSSFGPDTLKELRASWQAADEKIHVHPFMDMHDVGDCAVQAGLQEPVLEREEIVLTYEDVRGVMRDLRNIGAANVFKGRSRSLTGKNTFRRFEQAYECWRQSGRLPATYEVVYGTAWSGRTTEAGMARISVKDIGHPERKRRKSSQATR